MDCAPLVLAADGIGQTLFLAALHPWHRFLQIELRCRINNEFRQLLGTGWRKLGRPGCAIEGLPVTHHAVIVDDRWRSLVADASGFPAQNHGAIIAAAGTDPLVPGLIGGFALNETTCAPNCPRAAFGTQVSGKITFCVSPGSFRRL